MLSQAQNTQPISLATADAASELLQTKRPTILAAAPQEVEEQIPTFEETYPRYEFAPLVRLTIYLADEATVRRHAAYLWAFLVASAGAGALLLGFTGPTAEGK